MESNECRQQKIESLSSHLHSWAFGKVFRDIFIIFYVNSNDGCVFFVWHSVDQSRSFASYMHNDDNELQFFSLDFGGEPIAFHGGDILTKATFLNKALDAIVKLYEKAGRSTSTSGYIVIPSVRCSLTLLLLCFVGQMS